MRTRMLNDRAYRSAIVATLPLTLLAFGCGGDSEAHPGEEWEEGVVAEAPATASREAAPPSRPAAAAPSIPTGATLVFEVMEDVSTATHETGDTFRLRLVDPVSGRDGGSLAAGIEARGLVTEAHRSTDSSEEAVLGLQITSVQANGARHPIAGEVQSAELRQGTRDSGERTAAKIATGAAAGAVIGQILGRDTRSTVIGAAVGAAAGTGIALTTRDGHATLPRGSRVTVRLTEPLVLN